MKKVQILSILLSAVLILLIGIGAGACGGGEVTPSPGEEEEEEALPDDEEDEEVTPGPPTSGEWTASTDFGELRFTVNSGSTGITKVSLSIVEFECGGIQVSGGTVSVENPNLWPITDGRFTVDASISLGEMVIEGEFDETGTQASGTWEINVCSGTWEASP